MNRTEILDKAKECVTGKREQDGGQQENNFSIIGKLWSDYLGVRLSPVDVTMMMCLLKVARVKTKHDYEDSFVDICGYASFGGELAALMKEPLKCPSCLNLGKCTCDGWICHEYEPMKRDDENEKSNRD